MEKEGKRGLPVSLDCCCWNRRSNAGLLLGATWCGEPGTAGRTKSKKPAAIRTTGRASRSPPLENKGTQARAAKRLHRLSRISYSSSYNPYSENGFPSLGSILLIQSRSSTPGSVLLSKLYAGFSPERNLLLPLVSYLEEAEEDLASDVLSEEAILKWYKEAHLAKGKSVFLDQMKKFVEWLQNAEEESESEGEENQDG